MSDYGLATLALDGKAQSVLVRDGKALPLVRHGLKDDLLALIDNWDATCAAIERLDESVWADAVRFDERTALAPYIPRQVFCAGANYRKHVIGLMMGDPSMRTAEQENMTPEEIRADAEKVMDAKAATATPFCFIKLPSSVIGPNDPVILPHNVQKPDWELELGVVIGKRCHHVTAERAMDYVAGFAVVNDITARELLFRRDGSAIGPDWLSGKSFPTFLPFGPLIVPKQAIANPYNLGIRLSVNGKVYQDESTADMMISIERQIAFLSERVVLQPGDLLCTGSPYGNGSAFGVFLQPGDVMEGSITGLGNQRNPCVAEEMP
ncbi:fumarylacetoacetate hydrolase family protein [Novosphingobium mathurense]|uniref:2-keto-4-pentenoate hydratase/2-oxohepta-3-ene-1,7-dioic acid hydratase (Catechol pathway) n=1 Tax=Novosphingobium mathurense TaxID=428990 RepID=A0A1U6HJU9_9SPHN|nr:fumarylacetoacetate hydrolase family protein [Novosphingobium mathurense]SLJ96030.1 2-keto-4-pentenoate hydratase/2-oxohepta-3-ene-1,7-dioic acid hydratase (catechol pathway) [Novosphingobium mathurense]